MLSIDPQRVLINIISFQIILELICWNKMTTCPTFFGVVDKDLQGIAKALTNLYSHIEREWSHDSLISVMEELIGKHSVTNVFY